MTSSGSVGAKVVRPAVVLCCITALSLFVANLICANSNGTGTASAQSMSQAVPLPLTSYVVPGSRPARRMKLGVDADNWSGQIRNPAFEQGLVDMQIDFVSWHIQPDEETVEHLTDLAGFCRRHRWGYLFNTEFGNYKRNDPRLRHGDGTYRYDLAESTLKLLKDDPLFLGVVYDEIDLMQAMNGAKDQKGEVIPPYLVQTRDLSAMAAFDAVALKIRELQSRYASYGKRLIVEMTFPDYPFAYARGGALLAPKLMKETPNDLMYSVFRGAALEYKSTELWACADLWFLDSFPMYGKREKGYHTPGELSETLQFANAAGFDYVYVEMAKGLLDANYKLTEYGTAVIAFQKGRNQTPRGDWRTVPIRYYVKRFPDGYWGQAYSPFIPDHPYGSWQANSYHKADDKWFALLHQLSGGWLPADADTWNAIRSPFFAGRPYTAQIGLPLMVVYDHLGSLPQHLPATTIDFSKSESAP